MSIGNTCITLGCNRLSRCRGLCDCCYTRVINQVKKGIITFQELERLGKCLPRGQASNHHISKRRIYFQEIDAARRSIVDCPHQMEDGECPICEKEQRSKVVTVEDGGQNSRRELPIHVYKHPAMRGRRING